MTVTLPARATKNPSKDMDEVEQIFRKLEAMKHTIYSAGYLAARLGRPLCDRPEYADEWARIEWRDGWLDGNSRL